MNNLFNLVILVLVLDIILPARSVHVKSLGNLIAMNANGNVLQKDAVEQVHERHRIEFQLGRKFEVSETILEREEMFDRSANPLDALHFFGISS